VLFSVGVCVCDLLIVLPGDTYHQLRPRILLGNFSPAAQGWCQEAQGGDQQLPEAATRRQRQRRDP